MRKLKALVMVGGGRVNTSSWLRQQIVRSCLWSREPHPWFNFDTFSAHGFTCVNAEIIGTVFIQQGGKISTHSLQLNQNHGYRFSLSCTVKEIKHSFIGIYSGPDQKVPRSSQAGSCQALLSVLSVFGCILFSALSLPRRHVLSLLLWVLDNLSSWPVLILHSTNKPAIENTEIRSWFFTAKRSPADSCCLQCDAKASLPSGTHPAPLSPIVFSFSLP